MKIDSSASEKEKENDVVARKNRKRSRAVVTPAGNTLSVEDKVNGTWQQYEDEYIVSMVNQMGFGKWKEISESGLQHRLPKHIRARFVDVLDPQRKPKYTPWTDQEDQILLKHQQENGNEWAVISKKLLGRTTNDVKNRFHNRGGLKKALQGKRKGKENSTSTQTRARTTISKSRDIPLSLLPGIAATVTATATLLCETETKNTAVGAATGTATAKLPCETETTNTAGGAVTNTTTGRAGTCNWVQKCALPKPAIAFYTAYQYDRGPAETVLRTKSNTLIQQYREYRKVRFNIVDTPRENASAQISKWKGKIRDALLTTTATATTVRVSTICCQYFSTNNILFVII